MLRLTTIGVPNDLVYVSARIFFFGSESLLSAVFVPCTYLGSHTQYILSLILKGKLSVFYLWCNGHARAAV